MKANKSDYTIAIPLEEKEAKQDDQEKITQSNINEILQLLDKKMSQGNNRQEDINKIWTILENNKHLINYQHCKDNKLRSLLHIAKYNSKMPYEDKQQIVNMIVDVGYKLFKFSSDVVKNCQALFFVAAKGDYATLQQIVNFFKEKNDIEKLHDTKEGDNVLSFMLKFGDHTQENYLNSFKLLLEENIDFQRIDYYKNNIKQVIEKEKAFLERIGKKKGYYENLIKIEKLISDHNLTVDNVDSAEERDPIFSKIRNKYQLFHSVIERGTNFKILLKANLTLKDSDDGENTLLQLAIIKNNFEITKELLQKGADPNRIVKGRNEEVPLILAAKLNRDPIFREILQNRGLKMTNDMFGKCVSEMKGKFLNYLLESNTLDVDFQYKDKTPLYYAIVRKNRRAVQSLMQRGSHLTENCLFNINPKDLEEYLNSCIKFDGFKDDMEENDYKSFLVFDFFTGRDNKFTDSKSISETTEDQPMIATRKYSPEIETIRKIGTNKRLKHLLEHPLIYIFIMLKWYRVRYYYFTFVFLKFIFYAIIVFLTNTGFFNSYVLCFVLAIQLLIISLNFLEFKFDFQRYTMHFILEILIFLLLVAICVLKIIGDMPNDINQVAAFIIILISVSMLMTLGYHKDLSKWMAMAKRVFRNFSILLLFFLFPILAFAIAFKLLLPFHDKEVVAAKENEDFQNIPRAIFRTFVMLSGDLGDKRFTFLGGYIMFILFAIGMAIILMNFWTGVAVSDIKEIEEQSIIVAFNNVVVFIESVEKLYQFLECSLFEKFVPCTFRFSWRPLIYKKLPSPFLKSTVRVKSKKKENKFHYGIDLFINAEIQFKNNKYFKSLRLENDIISKIKSLYDEKDTGIGKTLKNLLDQCKRIEELLLEAKKLSANIQEHRSSENKQVNNIIEH